MANPDRSLNQYAQSHVNQTVAQTTYGANGAVIRTADEMVGSLLDIVAWGHPLARVYRVDPEGTCSYSEFRLIRV